MDIHTSTKNKKGFTLIEVLVVMTIIAVLVAIGLPNYLGARQRARDAKRKAELREFKNALRLYYNDYQQYPASQVNPTLVNGCGTDGDAQCPVCGTAEFAAGGVDGCATIYMKSLPTIGTVKSFKYYRCASGDDFRLKSDLENISDADILVSQTRCAAACGTSYGVVDYVMCAD